MKRPAQKTLAIAAALLAAGIVLAANLRMVVVAFSSQPACVDVDAAAAPAKRVC